MKSPIQQSFLMASLGLWLAIAVAWTGSADAEPLTRERMVKLASTQNANVDATRAQVLRAESLKAQVLAARWPQITLDVGVAPSVQATLREGGGIGSNEKYTDISASDLSVVTGGKLQILQPLFTFGKFSHRMAAANHGIRAGQAQVKMTQAEVALEAARIYEGFLFAREISRFLDDVLHDISKAIETTKDRLQSPPSDRS